MYCEENVPIDICITSATSKSFGNVSFETFTGFASGDFFADVVGAACSFVHPTSANTHAKNNMMIRLDMLLSSYV